MIKVITDSVASIPQDMLDEAGVETVTLFVNRDGVEYADSEMDLDAFYSEIHSMLDNIPTSSQPSQHTFEEIFEKAANAGDEIIAIFISGGLSGTFDGALRAARAVKARACNFSYRIIDSASAGLEEGWGVFAAVETARLGKTIDECAHAAIESLRSSRFLFTPESLTFLQKGGRIGGAAALLGNLVQLMPILTLVDGEVVVNAKVRTRKKALDRILKSFKEDIEEHGLKNVVVHYIGDRTPAVQWAKESVEPLVGFPVRVLPVSPVIGLHVGPAVGIAYECKKPIRNKITQSPQALCAQ